MTVERRYAARHQIDLPVYIRYGRRPFLGAHGRDLSEGGMFLAVQALTLPIGTLVELDITALGRTWRLPALVIHRNADGIGVMFREPQPALFAGLLQQVRAGTHTPPPPFLCPRPSPVVPRS